MSNSPQGADQDPRNPCNEREYEPSRVWDPYYVLVDTDDESYQYEVHFPDLLLSSEAHDLALSWCKENGHKLNAVRAEPYVEYLIIQTGEFYEDN